MASDVQILISAQDKATDSLNKVANRLDDMAVKLDSTAVSGAKLSDSMEKANNSILSFGSGLGRLGQFAVNSMYFAAMGAAINAVSTACSSAADAFFGWNSMIEQSTISFTTLLGSAEAADEFIKQMKDFAAKTPFEYKDVDLAAKKLLAFGWTAKDVIPDLTAIGNAAAGLSIGAEGINRIILALGQMSNKMKIDGQDIRQLQEAGVPAVQYLGQAFNLTGAQMMKLSETGITGLEAVRTLIDSMANDPKFANMMEKQSHSLVGVWSTVKDTSREIFGKIGESLFNSIKDAVDNAGATLQTFVTSMRQNSFLEAVGDTFGAEWESTMTRAYNAALMFWGRLKEMFSSIGKLFSGALGGSGGFDGFIVATAKVASVLAILTTTVAKVVDEIVILVRAMADFVSQSTTLSSIVIGLTASLVAYNLYTKAAAAATVVWTAVISVVGPVVYLLKAAIQDYGIMQGIATAATLGSKLALESFMLTGLKIAGIVGAAAAVLYEYQSGHEKLAIAIGTVAAAITLYTNRMLISAAATAVVSAATAVYTGITAVVNGIVALAITAWGAYAVALSGANIITVASGVVTAVVGGIVEACTATVALARAGWVAVSTAITGFSLASAASAVITAVVDGVIAVCTGTVALAETAWIAVSTAIEGFSIAGALASVCGAVLTGVMTTLESPLLLVAAAIGVVVVATYELYNNWDSLTGAAVDLWSNMSTGVTNILSSLGGWFQEYLPGVYALVTDTFSSISEGVKSIWSDMVTTVSGLFSRLFNWIVDKMGPIGTAIKSVAADVGAGISDMWDTLTKGISNTTEKVIKQAGPGFDLSSIPSSRYLPEDGDDGKEKKDKKSAYDTQYDKMTELLAQLDEKIQDVIGTTPSIALAKLNKEIVKAQNDINDAMAQGVDTTDVQEKLNEYAKLAPEKIQNDLLRAQQVFETETVLLSANTSKDKMAIAQATYNNTMAKLADQQEAWRKAGMTQEDIDNRTAAYTAAAEKTKTDSVETELENQYNLRLENINSQYKLAEISKVQLDKLDTDAYTAEKARLEALLLDEKITDEERAKYRKQLAAIKTNQDDINKTIPGEESVKLALEEIKNETTDYTKIITDAWGNVKDSVTDFFVNTLAKGKSFSEQFRDLFKNLTQSILAMFVQTWTEITIMNPLKNWFTGILSGTAAATTVGSTGYDYSAEGGSAFGGSSYIVGEHGIEVFTPSTSGIITSNNTLKNSSSNAATAPGKITVELNDKSGNVKVVQQTATYNESLQETVVAVWIDAKQRNVGGLSDFLDGRG
ncbi:MAG: tape measure protein [Veillonellales bacterium]